MRIAVYCGSDFDKDGIYSAAARELFSDDTEEIGAFITR